MEIDYQCTLDDYKEAMYSQMRRPSASLFLAVCGVVFLGIGLSAALTVGFSGRALLAITGGTFLILPLALRLFQGFWVERDFRKHPGFAGNAHLFVNDDGLRAEGDLDRRETKWAAFTDSKETVNLFILYEGARLIRVFPKRAFTDPQLSEFRLLLASKIAAYRPTSRDQHL